MNFIPPALELTGSEGSALPSLGKTLRDPAAFWPKSLLDRRAICSRAGARDVILVADPEAAAEILANRAGRYPRSRLHNRMLGKGYGENLLQGDRDDWRAQRREIARPITSERAHSLVPRLRLACEAMMAEWFEQGGRRPVDLVRDARRLALDSLYRSFFVDEDQAQSRNPEIDEVACAIASHRAVELKDELKLLRPLAARLLAARQGYDAVPDDINTLTLFLHAGHDNVAAALAWALWLLASRPDLQHNVRSEWQAARDRPFALSQLPVTNAIVRETLRLYPPIMQLIRDVEVETQVGEVIVGPGATAIVAIYAIHRSNLWWDKADLFMPERFLQGKDSAPPRAFWTPFGSGPRGCIGSSLAKLEMSLFVAMICDRFALEPNPGNSLDCHARWALRPLGNAPLFAHPHA